MARKATCTYCGKSVMVKIDGTLRLHRVVKRQVCDGSGREP